MRCEFLTDIQASALFVDLLTGLGWQVETADRHRLTRVADERLVAWAREHDFVLLTFDELRGQTSARVARELRRSGGKLITLSGGPEQPPERAAGRLLFHYPEWYTWLEHNDGRVAITDLKNPCRLLPASAMQAEMRVTGMRAFEPYLRTRQQAARTRARGQRQTSVPPEQSRADLDN